MHRVALPICLMLWGATAGAGPSWGQAQGYHEKTLHGVIDPGHDVTLVLRDGRRLAVRSMFPTPNHFVAYGERGAYLGCYSYLQMSDRSLDVLQRFLKHTIDKLDAFHRITPPGNGKTITQMVKASSAERIAEIDRFERDCKTQLDKGPHLLRGVVLKVLSWSITMKLSDTGRADGVPRISKPGDIVYCWTDHRKLKEGDLITLVGFRYAARKRNRSGVGPKIVESYHCYGPNGSIDLSKLARQPTKKKSKQRRVVLAPQARPVLKQPKPKLQVPPGGPAVVVHGEVQCMLTVRGATDRERRKTWKTSWGSYNKKMSQRKYVHINLANSNREEVVYTLKLYFVAESLRGRGRSIHSFKTWNCKLQPGKSWKGAIASDVLQATDDKYAALGVRSTTGRKFDGWVLVVSAGDETVKVLDSKRNRWYREKILALAREEGM